MNLFDLPQRSIKRYKIFNMKKARSLPSIALSIYAISTVFAAHAAGGLDSGGGNAVVCFQDAISNQTFRSQKVLDQSLIDKISSIESYDLYYAKLRRGNPPQNIPLIDAKPNEDYVAFIDRVQTRLFKTLPKLASSLSLSRREISGERVIWQKFGVAPIDDVEAEGLIDQDFCNLVTMASQIKKDGIVYLHLDERLFFHPLHSVQSQGTLMLHEFLYSLARERGDTTSRNTRLFLSVLLHSSAANTPMKDVIVRGEETGFIAKQTDPWNTISSLRESTPINLLNNFAWASAATADMGIFYPYLTFDLELNHRVGQKYTEISARALTVLKKRKKLTTAYDFKDNEILAELENLPQDSETKSAIADLRKLLEAKVQLVSEMGKNEVDKFDKNIRDLGYLSEDQVQTLLYIANGYVEGLKKLTAQVYTPDRSEEYKKLLRTSVIMFSDIHGVQFGSSQEQSHFHEWREAVFQKLLFDRSAEYDHFSNGLIYGE